MDLSENQSYKLNPRFAAVGRKHSRKRTYVSRTEAEESLSDQDFRDLTDKRQGSVKQRP